MATAKTSQIDSKAVRHGRVVWFSSEKGYGFINPEDGTPEVFVHHTAIQMSGFKTLAKDEEVEFLTEQGQKGPQAANVKRLGHHESKTSK